MMNRRGEKLIGAIAGVFAGAAMWAGAAATLPSEWKFEQSVPVSAAGLVKFSLPLETLDSARPALEDLRLYDDAGNAVPYFVERPAPGEKKVQRAKTFQVSLERTSTVIVVETGLNAPVNAITLETPASAFIKAVRVEGSPDRTAWEMLATGEVIFRQSGVSQLRVSFRDGTWRFLRLVVDDTRSQPVAFTGSTLHAASAAAVPAEPLPVTISERHESPGETRLALELGAAHLEIASVQIETDEPLFTRRVTLAVPQISEDAIRERSIAEGAIYRVAVADSPVSSNLKVAAERRVDSRTLLVLIHNQDNPPLAIDAVRVERRPVHLVFWATQPGPYHLLTGNSLCAAPRYDLAALGSSLKEAKLITPEFLLLTQNRSYRAPELPAGIGDSGPALDVKPWTFRKTVTITRPGAQVLDLDADVLSGSQPGFQDLRLIRGGQQTPYVLERTSISRPLTPSVTVTNDPKNRKVSRWVLHLSHRKLPITRLTCASETALFQREALLYEDVADERGERFRHVLGRASWTRTPARSRQGLQMSIESAPQTDALVLEIDNGDNAPIDLGNFRLFLPVTRLLFKARPDEGLMLYYGNPSAAAPRYDLGLVAGELLAAEKSPATPGAQEQLGKVHETGKGGVWFWAALAVVVVALLIVISRLLPKTSSSVGET